MTKLSKNTQVPQCDKTAVMCSAFYTPKIEEFYVGFEYESFEIPISSSFAFENKPPEWVKRKVVDINNSEYKGRALYHVSINNRYEENVDWNKISICTIDFSKNKTKSSWDENQINLISIKNKSELQYVLIRLGFSQADA